MQNNTRTILLKDLKKIYKLDISFGVNSANKSAGCTIYYTNDAPLNLLVRKTNNNYVQIEGNHRIISNSLGVDYPVHYITVN